MTFKGLLTLFSARPISSKKTAGIKSMVFPFSLFLFIGSLALLKIFKTPFDVLVSEP